jgi:hypothetical protein
MCCTLTSIAWSASPCYQIDRASTRSDKAALSRAIEKHLPTQFADVHQSFRAGGWTILYVSFHDSDDAYLFYSHDPLTSRPVTLWGGVAMSNEEQAIKEWTVKNAPGIPPGLANCFAWHVTNDPNL